MLSARSVPALLTLCLAVLLFRCGGGSSASGSDPSVSPSPGPSPSPPPSGTPAADVLTYHNDNARTGQNLQESTLNTANVNSSSFGKLSVLTVDGKVDAQPLYVAQLAISGGTHNVLYVASEHDSVYAFDADTGAKLWQVSLLASGETTSDTRNCHQVEPEIGITATPVIDRSAGAHGALYVVAMSKDSSAYHQRLHALDLVTGAEQSNGPVNIAATYPGTGDNASGGNVIFDPKQYKERPGLLLVNGVVYTTWSSHCDIRPYTGWVIGYSASTLQQETVLNVMPNGEGGSFWNSGAAPAADPAGTIFQLVANGTFETTLDAHGFPSRQDFGNSFIKISTAGGRLAVADYFDMFNTLAESSIDNDLGSGGALLLPDLTDAGGITRHLALGAGKDHTIYVVDRDSMGKFNPSRNNIYQQLTHVLPGAEFAMPAYFDGRVYFGSVGGPLQAFQLSDAKLSSAAVSQTSQFFRYPGTTPAVSADGASNGIVWAAENSNPAVLHAYDAHDLSHELYNSNQAGSRDHFGAGNKFITPTISGGKVYVGTTNGVGVFGLLK
jgi:outer membrane protein assembly factor BamB